jgi:hypothetical protein
MPLTYIKNIYWIFQIQIKPWVVVATSFLTTTNKFEKLRIPKIQISKINKTFDIQSESSCQQ